MAAAIKKKKSSKKVEDTPIAQPSRKSQVDAWMRSVNSSKANQGNIQISKASEAENQYHLRRKTGIMSLDIALGGGFPAGGISQIYGGDSVGKTYLSYKTAGEIQRAYGEDAAILFVYNEAHLDKHFARLCGFRVAYSKKEVKFYEDYRKSKGLPPFTKEEVEDLTKEVGTVIPLTGTTSEKYLGIVTEGVEKNLFQLVVIESLGALLSSEQEEKDVGEKLYGGSSVALTSFVNKTYPYLMMRMEDGSMRETTILGINQARAVMGATGRQKATRAAAGAWSWKHSQLINLELKKGAPLSQGKEIGKEIRWDMVKGKAGTHDGLTGSYLYYHVPRMSPVLWSYVEMNQSQWGADDVTDLVETAKQLGVFNAAGAWITWEDEVLGIAKKWNGAAKAAQELVDDDALAATLKAACLDAADLPVVYT